MPYTIEFSNKPIVILIGPETLFHVLSDFKVFRELYSKMFEKMEKIRFVIKCYNFGINKYILIKNSINKFKTCKSVM